MITDKNWFLQQFVIDFSQPIAQLDKQDNNDILLIYTMQLVDLITSRLLNRRRVLLPTSRLENYVLAEGDTELVEVFLEIPHPWYIKPNISA